MEGVRRFSLRWTALTDLCFAVDSYVQSLGKPELLDLVARSDAMDVDGVDDPRPNKKAVVYGEVRLCLRSACCGIVWKINEFSTKC